MNKLVAIAAILTAISTPVFAQYAPQDYQSGAEPRGSHRMHVRGGGLNAFGSVAGAPNLDDPSMTGGGSIGYNQLLRSF
jgi:hypothetical protein